MKSMLKLTVPFLIIFLLTLLTYVVKVSAVSSTPSTGTSSTDTTGTGTSGTGTSGTGVTVAPVPPGVTSTAAPVPPAADTPTPTIIQKVGGDQVTTYPYITAPAPGCGTFQDVTAGDPFYTYIQCLGCNGSVTGYQCGAAPAGQCVPPANLPYFLEGNPVTRGQLTKMVTINAHYNDAIPTTQQTFTDVLPNSTFWLYIERAVIHGLISGYACGGSGEPCDAQNRPYFRPNAIIYRGQAMKVVMNAVGMQNYTPPTTPSFEDVPTTHTFYSYIEAGVAKGVITGYACGGYNPGNPVGAGTPTPVPQYEPCDAQNRPYFRPSNTLTRGQSTKVVAIGLNCPLQSPPPVPPGSGTPPVSCDRTHGDADCSGSVDLVDYLYYVRYAAGVRTFPSNVNVDVTGNGTVDSLDRDTIIKNMGGQVPGGGGTSGDGTSGTTPSPTSSPVSTNL